MTIPIQNFEADTLVILKRCDYDAYLKKFCVKKKRLCQIHFYQKFQNMFLCRILRRFQWYQPFKEITTSHALFSFFFFTQKMRWCQDHRKQLGRSGFTTQDAPRSNFPSQSRGWCSFKAKITQLPLRFFYMSESAPKQD